MTNTYCVYIHKNKHNNKQYVGQTCQIPEKRWANGLGYKKSRTFFNAIVKYGWDSFDHIIVATDLTKEEADNLEILLIKTLKTQDPMFGYNVANGGSKGALTEEIKAKISHELKGKKHNMTEEGSKSLSESAKLNKPHLGKKVSKETRECWSKKRKGRKLSEEWKDNIRKGMIGVNKGKKHTEETKKRLSESHKGQIPWNKGKRIKHE